MAVTKNYIDLVLAFIVKNSVNVKIAHFKDGNFELSQKDEKSIAKRFFIYYEDFVLGDLIRDENGNIDTNNFLGRECVAHIHIKDKRRKCSLELIFPFRVVEGKYEQISVKDVIVKFK